VLPGKHANGNDLRVIEVKPNQDSIVNLFVSTRGVAVFLDAWAIKKLAKHDPAVRRRFIEAVHGGADILFSVSNAVELTGPQGDSFAAIRSFMDDLGPYWFPVELDPVEVTKREKEGKPHDECCFCGRFLSDYLATKLQSIPTDQVVGISRELFTIGHVMSWLAPQRDSITRGKAELDRVLIERIKEHRARHEADPGWLDRAFPTLPFNPRFPAMFTYVNLVRMLILESKSFQMTPGDGIDFCQAVIGTAFSNFATLDKKWKRRIEMLPPNNLARIYYDPELGALVDDIEMGLSIVEERRRAATLSQPLLATPLHTP
jgi:hypothetical protein